MLKYKSKRKATLLSNQKPLRSNRFSPLGKQLLNTKVIGTLIFGALAPLCYFYFPIESSQSRWEIVSHYNTRDQLSDSTHTDLINTIHKYFNQDKIQPMNAIAKKVQNQFALDSVHLIQYGPNQIAVLAKSRKPIVKLTLENRPPLLVTESGIIFKGTTSTSKDLITLDGVLVNSDIVKNNHDGSIEVADEKLQNILDSLNLIETLNAEEITISAVGFHPYRGFSIELKPSKTVVFMGTKPYTVKLQKLRLILDKLSKSGSVAKKIELDYMGKAFITETEI